MYQLVLRFVKHPFGALTLGNLTVQLRVGCNEIGGSLRHLALELVMCLLQRLLGRQTLLDRTTPLMQVKEQQENERQRHRSERDGVADERVDGRIVHQQHQPPRRLRRCMAELEVAAG